MGCLWDVYGMSMGCIWDVYGMSMGCLWDVYGMLGSELKTMMFSYPGMTIIDPWPSSDRGSGASQHDHLAERDLEGGAGPWPKKTREVIFVMCSLFLSVLFFPFLFFSYVSFFPFFLLFFPFLFPSFLPFCLSVCLSAFVFLLGLSSLCFLYSFLGKPWHSLEWWSKLHDTSVVKCSKGVLTLGFRKESEERPWHKSVPSQQLHSQFSIWMYLDGSWANSLNKWFTRCLGLGFISVVSEWIPLDTLAFLATSRRSIPLVSNIWNQGVTGYYCHLLSQHIKICPNTHILSYTYLGSITTRAIEENGLRTVSLQVS